MVRAACNPLSHDESHDAEVSALERLGRLLADVRAFARRGRKEVVTMLERLSGTAEQVWALRDFVCVCVCIHVRVALCGHARVVT